MSGEQSISIERSRLGKKLGEGEEGEEKKGRGGEWAEEEECCCWQQCNLLRLLPFEAPCAVLLLTLRLSWLSLCRLLPHELPHLCFGRCVQKHHQQPKTQNTRERKRHKDPRRKTQAAAEEEEEE